MARSDSRGRSMSADNDRSPRSPVRSASRSRSRDSDVQQSNGARRPTASRSRSRSRSDESTTTMPRSAKIVIEKLTKNVHEGHLRDIFGTYGQIQELEVPMNKQFMTNRGIAYILYTQPSYAEHAISHMHEAQLDGALISVSIVLPRRRFSRSPPPMRPPPNRFGEPHRHREGPPPRGPPGDRPHGRAFAPDPYGPRGGAPRRPSPGPPRYSARGGGGMGPRGYRDRYDDRPAFRRRSYSRSRSPPNRRPRSPAHGRSRSPEQMPVARGRGGGGSGGGGMGGAREPLRESFSSYGSRSRSASQTRSRRR